MLARSEYIKMARRRAIQSVLFFTFDDGVHGPELWKSEGTELGTMMIKDIFAEPSGSCPITFAELNGKLCFGEIAPGVGRELMISHATEQGTFFN